ncbi:MAG: hypothetical protein HY881_09960 [Deltaproteobacteria bacterium]|nr:hypothetical protein [Deltaproteobacteria bacterium]
MAGKIDCHTKGLDEKLAAAVPLSAFSPTISAENAPGFFILFLKCDISCKNPDKTAAIFLDWMQAGRNRPVFQKRFKFNLQL